MSLIFNRMASFRGHSVCASALERVGLERARSTLRGHSFWAGLDDVELAIFSILRPSLSRDKQTERLMHAMDNPHLAVLAHPTAKHVPLLPTRRLLAPAGLASPPAHR